MKLYTEEQVLKIVQKTKMDNPETYYEVLQHYTPIELPSDEEIRKRAVEGDEDWIDDGNSTIADEYERGAKWMKQQILNQNK